LIIANSKAFTKAVIQAMQIEFKKLTFMKQRQLIPQILNLKIFRDLKH